MFWPVGNPVVAQGLTSQQGQQLNGKQGVIRGRDASTGRLMVSFATGDSLDQPSEWKKLQPWNLRFNRNFAVDSLQPNRLAIAIGSEMWSRVLSFCHINQWPDIALVAPVLYTAAELAAAAVPYDGSYMIATSSSSASEVTWLRRTCIKALDLHALSGGLPIMEMLPLHLERFVLRSQNSVCQLGPVATFPHLLQLDIINASPKHRAQLLKCSLPCLMELRAGSPFSDIQNRHPEDILDDIGALGHIAALDIGYLRTSGGVDQSFWQPLFAQRNLRALDLSLVMTYVDFDAPLECITDSLLHLEALAIHGLRISNVVFKRFCETCPLRYLRFRHCACHGGSLALAYIANALKFGDFAGSIANVGFQEILSLQSWLEVQQPKQFIFTGLIYKHDEEALTAARTFAANFAERYDIRIGVLSTVERQLETLGGISITFGYLEEHGISCWGVNQRFFDIRTSIQREPDYDRVLLLGVD